MSNLFRSLALTTLFSFMFPVFLVSGLLLTLWCLSYLPLIAFVGQIGESQLVQFLSVFGNGYPITGLLIIGATCSFVGGVFDLFNFYLYQTIKIN